MIQMGAADFMEKYTSSSFRMTIDALNKFNNLIQLAIMCNVHNIWSMGVRFAFNAYKCLA